jgi:gluconolactonase
MTSLSGGARATLQRKLAAAIFAVFMAVGCATAVIDSRSALREVASGCALAEGPAVDKTGALFFSDLDNDRIMRLSPSGDLTVFRDPSGRANGLLFDHKRRLVMCQSSGDGGGRRVTRLENDGAETVLAATFEGLPFIAPNDLAIDSRGRIYFTDDGPPVAGSRPTSGVYRIDAPGIVELLVSDLERPHGILVTPDDRFVYVSDRGTQKLHRYRLSIQGRLTHDRVVYDFAPDRGIDGMSLDARGNIYGAAGRDSSSGLYVISPSGRRLFHCHVPGLATNTAFGGADRKDLYITASSKVFKMRTRIRGITH